MQPTSNSQKKISTLAENFFSFGNAQLHGGHEQKIHFHLLCISNFQHLCMVCLKSDHLHNMPNLR